MTDQDIFQHLFTVAATSKDPRGVVSACLVENGTILASAASSDDGVYHAEDILFAEAAKNGLSLSKQTILYATLEPCGKRSRSGMIDCVTHIIDAGIGEVVFGARDPEQSAFSKTRLPAAGIAIRQVADSTIIQECARIFNTSVTMENARLDVTFKPVD